MIKHLLGLLGGLVLIAACMFYPFLPGGFDAGAVTLFVMARLFAIAGLVLVPLGVAWLAHEFRTRRDRATSSTTRGGRRGTWFGVAALAMSSLVALVVSLGSLVDHHASTGVAALILWIYIATRLAGRLRTRARTGTQTFNPAPLYLIVWPLAAAGMEFTLVGPALEASRTRAIDESARLIASIEDYRARHGRYPASLQSLWDDYRPSLVGVRRYHYEPHGESYNVYFEHPARAFDIKEIVMYNPRGEQDFSSHNADLLELAPDDIAPRRGHVAVRQTSRPHWELFLFD